MYMKPIHEKSKHAKLLYKPDAPQSLNVVANPTFYQMSEKLGIKEMNADSVK